MSGEGVIGGDGYSSWVFGRAWLWVRVHDAMLTLTARQETPQIDIYTLSRKVIGAPLVSYVYTSESLRFKQGQ